MILMNDERMISFGYCAIKSSVIDLEIIDSTDYVSGVTARSEGSRGWLP
jgi:hypothetical protein